MSITERQKRWAKTLYWLKSCVFVSMLLQRIWDEAVTKTFNFESWLTYTAMLLPVARVSSDWEILFHVGTWTAAESEVDKYKNWNSLVPVNAFLNPTIGLQEALSHYLQSLQTSATWSCSLGHEPGEVTRYEIFSPPYYCSMRIGCKKTSFQLW